jgi:hypothetical protein
MNTSTEVACSSDNKSMQRPPTTMELFEEKLKNFKSRFYQDLLDMGLKKETIDGKTAIDVIAELVQMKLYWGMIEAWNLDFFLALAAAKPPPPGLTDAEINDWCKTQQLVTHHIQHMNAGSIRLGWQYANFFLNCTKELTKK